MKIIFLDIDGVLNSKRTYYAFKGYPIDLSNESLKRFDWVAIGLIRKLCKLLDAQIVLSSSWRRCFKIEDIALALNLPIIDKTPILFSGTRGKEIELWINKNKDVSYCIIDDNNDMLDYQKEHFVRTSHENGFLLKDYYKVIKMFGGAL